LSDTGQWCFGALFAVTGTKSHDVAVRKAGMRPSTLYLGRRIRMAIADTINDVISAAKGLLQDDGSVEATEPNAIDLLKDDHRKVEALFKTILHEKSSTLVQQRKNIATVLAELTLHAKIEESLLYPAVFGKTKRDSDERLEVFEAFEEHGAMKDLIKKIKRSSGRDESLKAKVQVLSEITEHHVKEEESTFFPEAEKLLGHEQLAEIGRKILAIKKRATGTGSAKRPKATSAKKAARTKARG
jgi:hemerythrin superfamily protein